MRQPGTWVLRMCFGLLCAAVLAPAAHATMMLRLTSGSSTITITDGGAGDSNPAVGVITFIGSVGTFTINVTTALSKPTLGSPISPHMDLNSVNMSSSAATLTIEFTDTDFTPPFSNLQFFNMVGGTVGSGAGNSASFQNYLSTTNVAFAQTTPIGSHGPFGPGAFSSTVTGNAFVGTSMFSLTMVANITHAGSSVTSFNDELELSGIPEPSSLVLLGSGLAGLGLLCRRRTRNN